MKKLLLIKICFVLLITSFSSVYAEDCLGDNFATCLRLAKQGHITAQYNLGVIYSGGLGVPQDYKEAVKWTKLSAVQGKMEAQYNLGTHYINGNGVPQDYNEAVKWLKLSAAQGYMKALNNLGAMYGEGNGVPQDIVMAHMYFNISGAKGNKLGIQNRDLASQRMTLSQIEKAQELAREWVKTHK